MREDVVLFECFAQNAEKEKIKISPIGEFSGIDKRKYLINPQEVIQKTKESGCDLLLDKNHSDQEALGWFDINTLEARDSGIYASLELNKLGKELVKDKVYRYLSPTYAISQLSEDRMIVDRIVSVSLVNRPNVLFHSLNKEKRKDLLVEEIEKLRKEKEELRLKIESLLKKQEEKEENAISYTIYKAIQSGEMLPCRKNAALSLKNQALQQYMDVCKEEARLTLQNKSINPSLVQDHIDPKIKEQLGIKE